MLMRWCRVSGGCEHIMDLTCNFNIYQLGRLKHVVITQILHL